MNLTARHIERITDPERVWEVRRFCQARNTFSPTDTLRQNVSSRGDAALSALLRCLLHELGADLAAISLLDDHTQFFLSVEHASDVHDPSLGRADWFGCNQIQIKGGICERTISRDSGVETENIYEILDLSADSSTKLLPVVDGTAASFRYYAGVPITIGDDLNIGALFFFKNDAPLCSLGQSGRNFLRQTARYTAEHLTRVIGALDNSRSLRCNSAASTFLQANFVHGAQILEHAQLDSQTASSSKFAAIAQMYGSAADVMLDMFDFDGVLVQELPGTTAHTNFSIVQKSEILVEKGIVKRSSNLPIAESHVIQLCKAFPNGAVLLLRSRPEDGIFIASTQDPSTSQLSVQLKFAEALPDCMQCVFMPLRDSFHNRDTTFILGWSSRFDRVYSSKTDLPALSAFGTNMTVQLQRIEAALLSRKKSDFLGSVSHEMRSPLHGLLACTREVQQTQCTPFQMDLLHRIEVCGTHLQSNIDKLLEYADIGSAKRQTTPALAKRNIIEILEQMIEDATDKHRRFSLSASVERLSINPDNDKQLAVTNDGSCHPTVIFETGPGTSFEIMQDHRFLLAVENVLDNCYKFSASDSCIKIALSADDINLRLIFEDTGRGMSRDFVRHNLLAPFVQEDPLDVGLGLGFVLTHEAIRDLGGLLSLETDESLGTKILFTLPLKQLGAVMNDLEATTCETGPQPITVASSPSLEYVRLFAPMRWEETVSPKQQQQKDVLFTALAKMIKQTLATNLDYFQQSEDFAQTIIVFDTDIEAFRKQVGGTFSEMKKVILCPQRLPQQALALPDGLGHYSVLEGVVTEAKLQSALLSLQETGICSTEAMPLPGGTSHVNHVDDTAISDTKHPEADPDVSAPPETTILPQSSPTDHELSLRQTTEPRFLLVDDNAINLKVIAMYAKKCSREPFLLASSGQQAIDHFQAALEASKDAQAPVFDIIVLDLSMPEVSGFDVARVVRKTESEQPSRRPTYIAALTGLTSGKDRAAAFEAGVDEYVTKPATVTDLKQVISRWRKMDEARA